MVVTQFLTSDLPHRLNFRHIQQREQQRGNDLWSDLQKFRNTLEQGEIFYDEDDFSNLRDRTPGREVNLSA
jgi:hypothetical protein